MDKHEEVVFRQSMESVARYGSDVVRWCGTPDRVIGFTFQADMHLERAVRMIEGEDKDRD